MKLLAVRMQWWLLPTVFGVCIFVGCGGSDTLPVSGTVTFDGVAVGRGEISFVPTDGTAVAGGVIENGQFAFEAKPGSKRVEIRASRPLPPERQSNPEMGTLYEDYLPARFNRESTLAAEVTAEGERVYAFALTSKSQ